MSPQQRPPDCNRPRLDRIVGRVLTAAMLTGTVAAAVPAAGEPVVFHWTNPEGGWFYDAANWDQPTPPALEDTVVFDLEAEYDVLVVSEDGLAARVDRLAVQAGVVTLELLGNNAVVLHSGPEPALSVGGAAGDTTTLRLVTSDDDESADQRRFVPFHTVRIGDDAGTTGTLVVESVEFHQPFDGNIDVGYAGTGTLMVHQGGQVRQSGEDADVVLGATATGSGHVSVDGGLLRVTPDSFGDPAGQLIVGQQGTGSLSVVNGGRVQTEGGMTVGAEPGSVGQVTVAGDDGQGEASSLHGPGIAVGLQGTGSLAVEAGAYLRTGRTAAGIGMSIGGADASYGSVMVRGETTVWDSPPIIQIGYSTLHPAGEDPGGSGTLIIEDGASATTNSVMLGAASDGKAIATARGQGTLWNTRQMVVGVRHGLTPPTADGTNILNIEDGATVQSRSGSSFVTSLSGTDPVVNVRGVGSTWRLLEGWQQPSDADSFGRLGVGAWGPGTLNVEDGGRVEAGVVRLGQASSGSGTVTVAGTGSRLRVGASFDAMDEGIPPGEIGYGGIEVGDEGTGTLTVHEGATLETGGITIGVAAGSDGSVILRGEGSTWTTVGYTAVGVQGTGTLTIDDGATATSLVSQAVLGEAADGHGSVTVAGAGSRWDIEEDPDSSDWAELIVGRQGTGTLTVADGAVVSAPVVFVGEYEDSNGTVEVTGQGSAIFGAVSVGVQGVGRLNVNDQAMVQGSASISTGGTLTGADGTVTGNVLNAGDVAPGNTVGTLHVDGDYQQHDTGLLSVAIGEHDHSLLAITGSASLDGGLGVELLPGAAPIAGDVFKVLAADSITGAFDEEDVNLPDDDWRLHYIPGSVLVSYGLLPGDMNLDGAVDTADVAAFVLALTDPQAYMDQFSVDQATMIAMGDINQDGAFDTADVAPFVQLLVGGDTSVPEPGSLVLLGLGGLLLLRRRRTAA